MGIGRRASRKSRFSFLLNASMTKKEAYLDMCLPTGLAATLGAVLRKGRDEAPNCESQCAVGSLWDGCADRCASLARYAVSRDHRQPLADTVCQSPRCPDTPRRDCGQRSCHREMDSTQVEWRIGDPQVHGLLESGVQDLFDAIRVDEDLH